MDSFRIRGTKSRGHREVALQRATTISAPSAPKLFGADGQPQTKPGANGTGGGTSMSSSSARVTVADGRSLWDWTSFVMPAATSLTSPRNWLRVSLEAATISSAAALTALGVLGAPRV